MSDTTPREAPETLIRAAIAGDREAYGALFALYYLDICRYVSRRVYPRDAEDIAAETFAKGLANLPAEWLTGSPRAWFFMIARGLVIDHHKRARTQRELPAEMPPDDTPDDTPPLERTVEARVLLDTVLAGVSPERRRLLVANTGYRLSSAELAAERGITPGALKALVFRAMTEVRQHVGEWSA